MKDVLTQFLNRNNINLNNQNVCIGISTGVDSTVLLHSLLLLKEEIQFNIILCHVNHKKREQSEIEEKYITDFSKKNNLQLEILHLDLNDIENENFQSAARMKRLQFFNDVMNKNNCKYLFLAHHLNDDIETSLMHIIRGSNLKGYCGIDEVVCTKEKKYILRPFLTILKEDIIEYSKNNNIKFFEDESNSSDCYTRNRIRHNLMPLLFEENQSFDKQFIEFKDTLLNSYKIVCEKRDSLIKDIILKENNNINNNNIIIIDLLKFNNLDQFMKTEILFEVLKKYQLSKANINELLKMMETPKANLITNYKNLSFCKQYNRVIISDFNEINDKNEVNIKIDHIGTYEINDKYYLEIIPFTEEDYKKNQNCLINLNVIWYNSMMFPFFLRNRKNGDRIKVNNGTKKIKDLLIDEKIPTSQRDSLLLLEKDNEIINIFGVKKSTTLLQSKNNNILITLREKE